MNRLLLLIVMLVVSLQLAAQLPTDVYQYHIDLLNVADNKVQVTLVPPKNQLQTGKFIIPRMVPGYYDALNLGQHISAFQAFDQTGAQLPVHRVDTNSWSIKGLEHVGKISYQVSGGWDNLLQHTAGAKSAESIFKKDSLFILNYSSVTGYFEEIPDRGYEVTLKKNPGFYASSALQYTRQNDTTDKARAVDYRRLVDAPVMYCIPDTTWIQVGNTKVLVSFYSKEHRSYSKVLAARLQTILFNQQAYLGGQLPVDRYAFLIYQEQIPKGLLTDGLEHSNSTVCLYGSTALDKLPEALIGVASHEFFHILTPLNIHSREVQHFNFLDPVLSKHLWLYEGMTEYATIHMPIKEKMIGLQAFLGVIERKIKGMDGFDNKLSMTLMSTNAIRMQDQYLNFYQKGALVGLCLDIRLRELSHGQMGTQELMQKLIKKYGSEKAFKDEDLFRVITSLTFPEIRLFFKDYVEDGQPIPLKETLQKVGLDYDAAQQTVTATRNPSAKQLSLRKAWIDL
ncbi:peptidase M61 [Taibaiella chishuiensis]|uniref:Putative metalloprotease with PDZ domain n=1 Tax=Taibaiella chishuiensis TaxID=1434707 RepID=A0A2P8CZL7_9BACT|nr:peptidase M61 [Taibaiella chishuiensis]PSK90428.1 putative metalloprotease with PDZ domain [Taibaiella chishuiensis]